MKFTDEQLSKLLCAAYLFGLEDGIRMPKAGEVAAKQVVEMIRANEADRVLRRVSFLLQKDCEAST